MESFASRTSRARLRSGITQADAIEQTKAHHRAIYDALRHRRPDLAGGLAIAHVASVEAWFEQTLGEPAEEVVRVTSAPWTSSGHCGTGCSSTARTGRRPCASFAWPALDEFNWALDWFDPFARGNDATGCWSSRPTGASSG